jgi:hypothetical protein
MNSIGISKGKVVALDGKAPLADCAMVIDTDRL